MKKMIRFGQLWLNFERFMLEKKSFKTHQKVKFFDFLIGNVFFLSNILFFLHSSMENSILKTDRENIAPVKS